MHIEVLVEDASGEKLLEALLPKLFGAQGEPHRHADSKTVRLDHVSEAEPEVVAERLALADGCSQPCPAPAGRESRRVYPSVSPRRSAPAALYLAPSPPAG